MIVTYFNNQFVLSYKLQTNHQISFFMDHNYDAIIIGAGPNGLAAGIRLVQKGYSVIIYESSPTVGGGTRTRELTLPEFRHDVCSAVHPMAAASPFLSRLPLHEHGLEWIQPDYPLAHPIDGNSCAVLSTSLEETVRSLGDDGKAYKKLMQPIVENWESLSGQLLAPFSLLPENPVLMARFGLNALQPARRLINTKFKTKKARALFAGLAAHSIMPFDKIATSAIGLILGAVAHHAGWPFPKGGSHAITLAMASYFKSLGGQIETGTPIETLDQLPSSRTILFNTTPYQILDIAKNKIPDKYASKLKKYQYGAGVFKLDLALSEPIPWKHDECKKAGTVHLGGTYGEILASEEAMGKGNHTNYPYVLLAQQSLFDHSRAPSGKHTCWAYCHVPNGSTKDMTEPILNQIERFAPGFRDCIIGSHTMNTKAMQTYNSNYIGGDINGGKQDIKQLFTRPAGLFDPYHIPDTNMYICSSSTPPGGGVHGMCGFHAAESVLKSWN